MRKYIGQIKLILFALLAIVMMFLVFRNTDINLLIKNVLSADLRFVFLSLFFAFAAFLIRAYRWKILITPFGKISFFASIKAVFIGYLANMAFPRMGEVTRCGVLSKQSEIKIETLIGTVVTERISDVVILLGLMGFLFVAKLEFFGSFLYKTIINPVYTRIVTIDSFILITVLLSSILVVSVIFLIFKKHFANSLILKKAVNFFHGIKIGIKSIYNMQQKKAYVVYSLLIWFLYWAMTYSLFFAIPATAILSPIDAIFILVVGGLGMTVPVQNGFGVYHGMVASALMLYGVDYQTNGLLYATIGHESQTLLVLIMGSISLLLVFLQSSSNKISEKNVTRIKK